MGKKNKIGRNDPCLCGSGLKYKKCCYGKPIGQKTTFKPLSLNEAPIEVQNAYERFKANEYIRQQQQGLGKPIIATKFQNQQVVAVGNTIYSSPKWKTFPDFLSSYLKNTMGEEWGNSELKKPLEERHPILQWYDLNCKLQNQYLDGSGKITPIPSTGAVYCFLGLAYNLYLLRHNVELQRRFINRLKDINNFQGAYYELIVANCLIRSGFELELEDETDVQSKHCEFSALSKKTGKKYWVEAKMRSVAGMLGKTTDNGTTRKDPTCMLSKHLNGAFQKPANDERLIFIDVNTSFENDPTHSWGERAGKKLDMKEKDLRPGQVAYVFVTNTGFHWNLDSEKTGHAILAHGLGIADFGKSGYFKLSELYRRKQRHIDAHDIMEAFRSYPKFPETFDGSLPSETFNDNPQELKIGETYFFEGHGEKGEGEIMTVTSATVDEKNKTMLIGTSTGFILSKPMSSEELDDYKSHPEAYFGRVQHSPRKKMENLYELFEFFLKSYRHTPKEKLLELMKGSPDFSELQKMNQADLAIEYSERCCISAEKKVNLTKECKKL